MTGKSRLCLILFLSWGLSLSLQGKRMDYTVKSMGLGVATLSIERDVAAGRVRVETKSLITNALFPSIDNTYTILHNTDYLPLRYSRLVRQDKLKDDVETVYNHSQGQASESHSPSKHTVSYKIGPTTRDFFSFVSMLSDGKGRTGVYELDANGSTWKVTVSNKGSKEIKTPAGKFLAKGYQLSFSSATHAKPPYVDMVTHNLFHKNSKVELWVDGKGLVVKASMKKGAIGSTWELKEVRP